MMFSSHCLVVLLMVTSLAPYPGELYTKSRIFDSFSLRPSGYFCGLCVEMKVKRRESRATQRTAEKTTPKISLFVQSNPGVYSTQAQAQVPATSSKVGSIKGRVLSDGEAVTNASVTVSSVNSARQTRTVPANDNGDFEVKALEPGMYRVEVYAPAYVSLPVAADEEIHRVGESITVNMIKGSVITGKVSTADNDPVVAVRVRAMMIRDGNGERPVQPVQSFDRLTDDRGVYRIFGLLPGTYVVFAGGRGLWGAGANAYDNDAPSYAPSSTRDTAEEISLGRGEERTIDIRYRGTTGHSVSGTVNAATTPDVRWMTIKLERIVNAEPDLSISTYARDTKGFEFTGVADGNYLIWAEYGSRGGEVLRSEQKRITVNGADLTGIDLTVRPLASVAGVVVWEPSTVAECKGKARPLFEETLVSIQSKQKQSFNNSLGANPDGNGAFQLRNLLAGQYNFNIRFYPRYWYLRSLTLPGAKNSTTDLGRNWLTLKAGERVSGLKATVSEGASSISGQIELSKERRSARIVVYVVPAEKDKADDVLRHFAAPVAEDGSFSMDHVPPGRYWTLAKIVTAKNETSTAALRVPAMAEARVKLRREAEDLRNAIELKPCQSVHNHTLPLSSH